MATATLISFACRALQLPYVSEPPAHAGKTRGRVAYTYQRSDTLQS